MSLGPDDLILTGSSLGHPPFDTLVSAAAAAGFAGLSLWPHTSLLPERAAGRAAAELRRVLADAGLVVNDIDAITLPIGGEETAGTGLGGLSEFEFLSAGEALGARYCNVIMSSQGALDVDRAAERFAALCARAEGHGLRCYLEFVPFMPVGDLASALGIVEGSGRPEAGLMVDSWHCFRGATTAAELLALDGRRVLGVQVNDAPATPSDDPVDETLHHRLLPGEGDIDLAWLVTTLRARGCVAPLCVEVFSDALVAAHPPAELARRFASSMRGLVGPRG